MTLSNIHIGSEKASPQIRLRSIGYADVRAALQAGWSDFLAAPSHLAFLGLIYPVLGLVLGAFTFSSNALPLLFPLISGFALIAPVAAVGLYELSRRREDGLDASIGQAFNIMGSPSLPAILTLGVMLMALFVAWMFAARLVYQSLFGPVLPESLPRFIAEVLTTRHGWTMILIGNAVGFVFALTAFSISVLSFPLVLDRGVGAVTAVQASINAVAANPGPMAVWALTIAVLLAIGSIPLFVGLAVVMPVLGHASWHLYRRAVAEA